MSIQDACALFGVLYVVGQVVATLFVASKINASEKRITKEMADTYLPREVAAEKFRYYDYRLGDPSITPPAARRLAHPDDE